MKWVTLFLVLLLCFSVVADESFGKREKQKKIDADEVKKKIRPAVRNDTKLMQLTEQNISKIKQRNFLEKFDVELDLPENPKRKEMKKQARGISTASSSSTKQVIIHMKNVSEISELRSEVRNMGKRERKSLQHSLKQFAVSEAGNSKHQFKSFEGFSANLTQEEINYLESLPFVESIEEEKTFSLTMQDTVELVNATKVWREQINGTNVTGHGQTVCIIDSGIDYTHPDLGGCTLGAANATGNEEADVTQSPHPYPNSYSNTFIVSGTGYDNIAVHFVNISTEDEFDYVNIYDGSLNLVASYAGSHTDIWSPSVEGNTIYVELVTDQNTVDYGFYIDKKINGTGGELDWSNCTKVIDGFDFVNGDGNPIDDNDHGTHVSGTVAANGGIKGIAPDAKLIAAKTMNAAGDGVTSDIVKGIEFCTDHADTYNISVISMSIGSDTTYTNHCDSASSSFKTAINRAVDKNISVVVSSGNDGSTSQISLPACMSNATPVSSLSKTDTISSFSNRNSLVNLMAPGGSFGGTSSCNATTTTSTHICSTVRGGTYNGFGGTSMSAPHVSGAIAVLNQYASANNITKSPLEWELLLNHTGVLFEDSGSSRNYSRIDVNAAYLNLSACSENVINTTPEWTNISCTISDLMNQTRNVTTYDANFCGTFTNVTATEYQLNETCDYCTQNLTNITTSWVNVSCSTSDLMNQTRNITTYDANKHTCSDITNISSDIYNNNTNLTVVAYQLNGSCNFCTQNVTNISTAWVNISCTTSDVMNQTRNVTTYDANKHTCSDITGLASDIYNNNTNITTVLYQTNGSCDFCSPSFICSQHNTTGSCLTVVDQNNCYAQTGLVSDNFTGNISLFDINVSQNPIMNKSEALSGLSGSTVGNATFNSSTIPELRVRIGDLDVGNFTTLSGRKNLTFKNGNDLVIDFTFNFSNASINFSEIIIEQGNGSTESFGFGLIKGINSNALSGTKTIYVERVNASFSYVCIEDAEIDSINEVSSDCTSSGEQRIECNGATSNGYTCTLNSTSGFYKIEGLQNSGVKQTADPPSSGGGSGGGGGGGGGGGSSSTDDEEEEVCKEDWICTSWSECEEGVQTRQCFDSFDCGTVIFKPRIEQDCVVEDEIIVEDADGVEEIEDILTEAVEDVVDEIVDVDKHDSRIILGIVAGLVGIGLLSAIFLSKKSDFREVRKKAKTLEKKMKKDIKETKKHK